MTNRLGNTCSRNRDCALLNIRCHAMNHKSLIDYSDIAAEVAVRRKDGRLPPADFYGRGPSVRNLESFVYDFRCDKKYKFKEKK